MTAEIYILSGSRKGEQIVLDGTDLRIGSDPQCDVCFNPVLDPSAREQSVRLRLDQDGWFIQSTGSGEVLLNQTVLAREMRIRSGDLVRLSDNGPDFSVSMNAAHPTAAHPTAAHSTGPEPAPGDAAATTASEEEPTGEDEVVTAAEGPPRWKAGLRAGVVAAGMLLCVTSFWLLGFRRPPSAPNPAVSANSTRLRSPAPQTIAEGSELRIDPETFLEGTKGERPRLFLTGQPPRGARIDPETGVFTWTPDEGQGPGQYTVRVGVAAAGGEGLGAETLFQVDVEEVNSPPKIRPIEEKQVDAGKELLFPAHSKDPDAPANRLAYRLSDHPDWMSVDSDSGVVRCVPSASADGTFEATIHVTDDGSPPLEDQTVIKIVVNGDPWLRVQEELRKALFLTEVRHKDETGTDSWAFATCSPIDDHTLLCSAREVQELAKLQRQGFEVVVVNSATGFEAAVRSLRVPKQFNAISGTPGDWIYFNLGLIEIEEKLPQSVPLATLEELSELEEGLPVGCFGFSHDGSKLTHFDKLASELIPAKVYRLTGLRGFDESTRILDFRSKIKENMYGSPILNDRGALIAVYGEAVATDNPALRDIHYATLLNLPLLQAWLRDRDEESWPSPAPPRALSPNSPSPPEHAE